MTVHQRRVVPTLEDVAAAAGVSRSTASRAINGGPRVSADAQAAVDAAVLDLGFIANRAARALVTHRAGAIALVIGEPDHRVMGDPFFAACIQGLSQALADGDQQLVLVIARPGEQDRARRFLRGGHVDGAVVVSQHRSDTVHRDLAAAAVPAVFVGRPWPDPHADRHGLAAALSSTSYVDVDNAAGAELATQRLLADGCRRIGTIAGPADMIAGHDRLTGWRAAMAGAGRPVGAVEHGDFTRDGGAAATARLLDAHPDVDGLFVASDLMAAGALTVLRERGRAVPDDVKVVGYDDSVIATSTDPALTTVVNPVAEMARTAGLVLLERMAGDQPPGPATIFAPRLVARASG